LASGVRLDARPLVREPFACAAHAALNLVEHQQPTLLVAQRAHGLQVVGTRGVHAAFTLDHLKEHGCDIGVRAGDFFQRSDVVERHAHEAFDQRLKASVYLGIAGGRQRGNRAAMKGLFIHDHFSARDALVVAVLARNLQSGLIGFQARVAEEDVGHARALDQQAGQLFLQRHLVVVAAVDHLLDLILQCGHQFGVLVAQRVHGDAGERVQIASALGVPDAHAFAMRQGNGQAAVSGHHMGHRHGSVHGNWGLKFSGQKKNGAAKLRAMGAF